MPEGGGESEDAALVEDRTATHGHAIGAIIGAVGAWLVFLVVLADGHVSLLRRDGLGEFFDIQARALLRGHWYVPRTGALALEPIFVNGKAFIYYGPWPSILRLPVLIFTHRFDGRLTQLSMLLAFTVAMVFTVRITSRVRALVRPHVPPSRLEQWALGGFVFVVGAGSVLQFLGSAAFLYHESELWGAALAIAAFDAVIAYIVRPTGKRLAMASTLATLGFLSRGSVGSGPVAALGLLLVVYLWRRGRRMVGMPERPAFRHEGLWLLVAVSIPIVLYAYVNYAKFGTFFTVPANRQLLYVRVNAARRAALTANGNSLFGLRFVPTALLQALRPDGLRLTSMFPWVTFPAKARVVGGATFDTIDNSTSITALMPALSVLALIGGFAVVAARGRARSLAALRAPVLGALAALPVTLGIAFIAQRYLTDYIPLLVILGAAGLPVVLDWRPTHRAFRRVAVGGLAVLGIFSVWANVGLAVVYQRLLAPTYVTEASIADFVRTQVDIHRRFPGGPIPRVGHGSQLPHDHGMVGDFFVVGDCEAAYWSNGTDWYGIDRTRRAGHRRLRVMFSEHDDHAWQPLFTSGRPGAGTYVAAQLRPGGRLRVGVRTDPTDRHLWLASPSMPITAGRAVDVDIVYDPRVQRVTIRVDGRRMLDAVTLLAGLEQPTVGRSAIGGPVTARLAGTVSELPSSKTLCRELRG